MFEKRLKKLTIYSYRDEEMLSKQGSIEAQFNPESIDLSYHLEYEQSNSINDVEIQSRFTRVNPGSLKLDLIFDTSLSNTSGSVEPFLSELRQLTTKVIPHNNNMNAEFRGSPYLKVKWGKMEWNEYGYFAGRLSSLSINYQLFDRDATPIRAVASLEIVGQSNLAQKEMNSSGLPPVSSVSAPDMSSLPSIAASLTLLAAAAGSAVTINYLQLAQENDLDNLDAYEAGDTLVYGLETEEHGS